MKIYIYIFKEAMVLFHVKVLIVYKWLDNVVE